nr:nucleic acid-binding, OB-fold protein [Tanacetum cinerariifolium]
QQDIGTGSLTLLDSVSSMYVDIGDCRWSCNHCGARFWYGEHLKGYSNARVPK